MNVFIELVKNDLNISKNRRKFSLWSRIYIGAAFIISFISYTITLIYHKVNPSFIIIVPAFLTFPIFAVSISMVKREWRNHTVGWWLSLPYTRTMLLASKLTAGIIRTLKLLGILALVSLAFWFEGMLLRPDLWNNFDTTGCLLQSCFMYGIVLLLCPSLLCFGMLLSLLRRSKWRPATPLACVLFPILTSFSFPKLFSGNEDFNQAWETFSLSGSYGILLLGAAASLLLALVMFFLSVYILEKQVEI